MPAPQWADKQMCNKQVEQEVFSSYDGEREIGGTVKFLEVK